MSLYDDDIVTDKTAASGWASGIKLMQNQLAFKKASVTAGKREQTRKRTSDKLPPVIDLKSRKEEDDIYPSTTINKTEKEASQVSSNNSASNDPEWKFVNEYDPLWPNDYEKVVREMRDKRDKEEDDKRRHDREERDRDRDRDRDKRRKDSYNSRYEESGFSRHRNTDEDDEAEEERPRKPNRSGGVAIAPPPSLDEGPPSSSASNTKSGGSYGGIGGSVAAKIMAKYGFREGQGLGKSQQGIVKALEVEKTSKRGGRIVTENEGGAISPPPPLPPPPPSSGTVMPPPTALPPKTSITQDNKDNNIANMLRNPSKVALLKNMVGPGEVDDDLEPEVREECSSKYGPVAEVLIFEIHNAIPEEAVRIFVEFKRMEAAIKAVIDLNGRFFGGRQVKAGFYEYEHFKSRKLNEDII